MQDVKKKDINYSFNNLDITTIKMILNDFGFNDDFLVLPFMGFEKDIQTLFFKSETSNKSIILYGKKVLFIKEIPWYCCDEDYIDKVYNNIYNNMRMCSDKIPELYKNISKDKFYTKINGKFYIVMDYISSNFYNNSKEQAYNVAYELAKIHKAFAFKIDDRFYKDVYSSAKDMIILANKEFLLEKLDEYNMQIKDYDIISSLVYGDSTPSNYLFDGDGVKAIIDFDNVKYDNPVRDLAESIISFAVVTYKSHSSSYKKIFNPVDIDISNAILQGYKRGLGDDDMFNKIIINLKPVIYMLLLLFFALAFLKDSDYNEDFNINNVQLDSLDKIINNSF